MAWCQAGLGFIRKKSNIWGIWARDIWAGGRGPSWQLNLSHNLQKAAKMGTKVVRCKWASVGQGFSGKLHSQGVRPTQPASLQSGPPKAKGQAQWKCAYLWVTLVGLGKWGPLHPCLLKDLSETNLFFLSRPQLTKTSNVQNSEHFLYRNMFYMKAEWMGKWCVAK